MRRLSASSRAALCVAALLASLSFVAWRQGRALEAFEELDSVRREISLARAEAAELERRIQYLESRSRVVPAAAEQLGMHLPERAELEIISGGAP